MKKSVKDFRVGDEFVLRTDLHLGMTDTCDEMLDYCGKTLVSAGINMGSDFGDSIYASTWCWYNEHIDWDATNKLYEKGHKMTNSEPTRTVNVTKTNGDSVQMKFSYKDSEETVEYTVEGDGDLGDIMVMLREVVTFMTHLGFSEEVVLRKMKQYVEDSEI